MVILAKIKTLRMSQQGFSLVEVIVASILLAIVSVGLFSVTLSSKKITMVSSQRHTATDVGETILDSFRSYLGDNNWTNNAASPFAAPDGIWQPGPNNYYGFGDGQGGIIDMVADVFRGTEFDTRYNGRWRYRVIVDTTCDWNAGNLCEYRKVETEVVWNETEV